MLDAAILKDSLNTAIISVPKRYLPKAFANNTAFSLSVCSVVDGTVIQALILIKQFFANSSIPVVLKGDFLDISEQERAQQSQKIITPYISGIFEYYFNASLIDAVTYILKVSQLAFSNLKVSYTSNYFTNMFAVLFNSIGESAYTTVNDTQTNFDLVLKYMSSKKE